MRWKNQVENTRHPSPVGTKDLSPPLQRWVSVSMNPSPFRDGTSLANSNHRSRNFDSSRRISKYSQISVIISAKALYHSIYFGAP